MSNVTAPVGSSRSSSRSLNPQERQRITVDVKQVSVARATTQVLAGVSTRVREGTVLGLPSGRCGKTTLLRSIVGVQRMDGGAVTAFGEPAGAPGLRHKIDPNRPGHLRLEGTSWLCVPVR